jgi:hypothetical protein
MRNVTALACAAFLAFAASPAGAGQRPVDPGPPDFFFGEPKGSIGVRGSWVFARAGSDLFDFVTEQLTLERGDFNTPAFGFDVGVTITPRVDAVVGFEISRARKDSEYRDFVDNQLLPINQSTSLRNMNLTGSIKYALTPKGRSISRFAWIPRAWAPYVGAGGGLLWYKFEQSGDFIDYVDFSVFPDFFESKGMTPSVHVFGGTDVQLHNHLYMTLEGRYLWAAGKLSSDFVDFDPIDLAGFRLAAGINFVF